MGKRVDALTAEDIRRLVDNGHKESQTLDYKRELCLEKDDQKKEFLQDVTAFYNTDGGCVVFGIEEKKNGKENTGEPGAVTGIGEQNEDALALRIEDLIRVNTEPAVTGLRLKFIDVDGKKVLVLGIPKGLGLPSMVTIKHANRFTRRKSTGKYYVDVYELNDMFMKNQVLKDRAEAFRQQRLQRILNKEAFPMLNIDRFCVVHVIPYSFLDEKGIDISCISMPLMPMEAQGATPYFNIDGYVSCDRSTNGAYTLFMRNGVMELYSTLFFFQADGLDCCISGDQLHNTITTSIQNALTVMRQYGIEEPFLITAYFHNLSKTVFMRTDGRRSELNYPTVELPLVVHSSYDTDLKQTLRPLFDMFWQGAGYPKCDL